MPWPVAAAVAASASLTGTGINAYSQGKTNRKTRNWNEKMYEWQRRDALADYTMQNEYNSPTSQMARLREAGLNPNLVYGDGATTTAAPVRSSDTKNWSPHAPQVDLSGVGDAVFKMYDVQVKQAQIDNLKTENTVLTQERLLKEAQTKATLHSAGMTEFDLGLKQELRPISLEAADANLRKTQADTRFTLNQNERAAVSNVQSLLEGAERILTMRLARTKVPSEIEEIKARIANLKTDTKIKETDLKLKQAGIQPHDALWQRKLAEFLNGIGPDSGTYEPGKQTKKDSTHRKNMIDYSQSYK